MVMPFLLGTGPCSSCPFLGLLLLGLDAEPTPATTGRWLEVGGVTRWLGVFLEPDFPCPEEQDERRRGERGERGVTGDTTSRDVFEYVVADEVAP